MSAYFESDCQFCRWQQVSTPKLRNIFR